MAVAVAGTPAAINAGDNYTAESGSNRVVVISLANRTSDTGSDITPTVSALSFGSASLANGQVVSAVETAAGSGANWRAGVWYVKEANIPAGANAVSVTWSHTMQSTTKIACHTLTGVDQTTPIDTTITKAQSSSTTWQQAVTVANNSANVSAAVSGAGGVSATPDSGWTESQDATNGGSVRAYAQYRAHATGGSVTWGLTVSSATSGRIAIASFAETSVVAPSFTSGPTHTTAGTGGNTYSCTPNLGGDTSATWHIGVYKKDSATPSIANVKAGSGTGFLAHVSKSVTGADTQATTGLTFPLHDVYHVLTNSAGDSSLSSDLDRFKAPPTGYQYVTFDVPLVSNSPFSTVSPALVDGDVLQIVLLSSPGNYSVTVSVDGDVEVNAGGDNSCQLLAFNIYDVSAGDLYYTSDSEFAVNDSPPNLNVPDIAPIFLTEDAAMTPVNLITLAGAIDPDGHTVTCSAVDALSNGLSISSGTTIGGTPDTREIRVSQIKFQDPYGAFVLSNLIQVVGQVAVPNLVNTLLLEADDQLDPVYLLPVVTAYEASVTVAAGYIIRQTPAAATLVNPNTEVQLVVSLGQEVIPSTQVPAGSPRRLRRRRRIYVEIDDGTIEVNSEQDAQELLKQKRRRKSVQGWDETLYGDEYGDDEDSEDN